MTRDEVAAIIIRVYNCWNERLPSVDRRYRELLDAWESVLKDLTNEEALEAATALIAMDGDRMPRPATLRRWAMKDRVGAPPTAWEAWNQLRTLSEGTMSGHVTHTEVHDVLRATIASLGGAQAYSLNTNGDRQWFVQAYTSEMSKWEVREYKVK